MKKKRVLVTGADGFIGSHLVEELLKNGYQVRALSLYNSFNYWGWLEDIEPNDDLQIVCGDIRDPSFCRHIVTDIEIIYHLAALIAIPYSYIAPDSYIETNVKGTLNVCEAALMNGKIRMINTSTSEVYGTAKYVPIDENHPKQPQSPYSASKIGSDAIALSFFNAFDLPVTIARPFNTYGPRQSARAVIPSIIIQIAEGQKEIKVGNLKPTRDFNFVKDTCKGIIALSETDTSIGKEVNICSNTEISIQEIFEQIKEIMNSNVEFIEKDERFRPSNSEVYRLWGDNKLLKDLTGFTPFYTLRKGLSETCQWFSNPLNLQKFKSTIYNI